MPDVNIKVTREGASPTPEQKAQLIVGVTQLLVDVLGKNPATTLVVVEEVGVSPVKLSPRAAPAAPDNNRRARCLTM